MYYSSYNPFYMHSRNYIYPKTVSDYTAPEEKKDIDPQQSDTISFQDFYSGNVSSEQENISEDINSNNKEKKNRFFSVENNHISLFGFSLELDDLIIIALILLLLLESDENLALIILLGLILFNINLSDIFNLF